MCVLQHCTHPHFQRYEITCIHAALSTMTCVSPASTAEIAEGVARLSYAVSRTAASSLWSLTGSGSASFQSVRKSW